jgi:predicted RND superfamily exporter protein
MPYGGAAGTGPAGLDEAMTGADRAKTEPQTPLRRVFAGIIRARWFVLAVYAVLVPLGAFQALKVGQDNSLDRLIVPSDPDYVATRAFQQVFGAGEFALLLVEAADPFAPAVLERIDRLERALAQIPRVQPNSALSIFRRTRPSFDATPDDAAAFRAFATGTDLLRRQGLVADGYLAIALGLDVGDPAERQETLDGIDRAIVETDAASSPVQAITPLGLPFVNAYLDESQRDAPKYFGLFAVFTVALVIFLYRSVRTLLAIVVTLAVCLALSVGYIGWTGGTFTLVSPMVPMTVLVTALSSLVYLHSRFVQRPESRPEEEHQLFALENKFLACTASIFATGVGFGALTISSIRPIYEMGVWVAVGCAIAWAVTFTLFPVLQYVLRTPTRVELPAAQRDRFERLADWLPLWTYHFRWLLLAAAVVLSAVGAGALFGVPGWIAPMRVLTDPVEYIQRDSPLYIDIQRLKDQIPGQSITEIWLRGELGSVSEPEVLTGLHGFQQALEADPEVGSAVGATTLLRLIRYMSGQGDAWPETADEREQIAADLEGMVSLEPMLQHFVQPHELAQTHITVISRATEEDAYRRLDASIQRHWREAVARDPALGQFELATVGLGPLHAKMAQSLVPTLVESFALTVVIIFATFLVVFRSGTARLLAMIPSLFAILVMFAVMRATGMELNVATILIASTVLGTSENDQIHFFWHFQEGRRDGNVNHALRHTLRIAGRAIFYATLINAIGFLAFGVADLPPLRQFGVLASIAFLLSMIADFTALPAALWILSRERPDDRRPSVVDRPAVRAAD